MIKVRKFLGAVMAAMLCFALTPAAAFAAAPTQDEPELGKITIEKAIEKQTYTIYRIFDLESYDSAANAYSYKVAEKWAGFFGTTEAPGIGQDYFNIDASGYVTEKAGFDGQAFANAAIAYANGQETKITADGKAGATNEEGQTEYVAVFENLPLGYYLVDSSTGALCSLDTTNPDVTIKEKNDAPVVDKKVLEGNNPSADNASWGTENDAAIGDTVYFQATITSRPGAQNYVLHDTMTDGLTFMGVDGVTINGAVVDASLYTEKHNSDASVAHPKLEDGCTFEVSFTEGFYTSYFDQLAAGASIVVSYHATLNSEAVLAKDGSNDNTVHLTYGDSGKTLEKTTETKTYSMNVSKIDAVTMGALEGAEFTLSRNADGTDPIKFLTVQKEEGTVDKYRVDANGSSNITTDKDGYFEIEGLDGGTYYLTEVAAPSGYNKLSKPETIVVGKDGEITINVGEKIVENRTGTELPSTGGIGTTIFYIVGGLLVVGAVVFFVRRRSHATK